nr:MAG TPA: prohead serine protease [Caudoviricetes sp.]
MKEQKEIEKRGGELQIEVSDRLVSGYAVVFDTWSNDLGFYEKILKGAITEDTIKRSDVICKLNHDDQKVLGRSKYGEGSLILEVDDKGLKYTFEAPRTQYGDELLEYLRRGDITGSSFAFTIEEDEFSYQWPFDKDADPVLCREVIKVDKIFDVSPVFSPAYEKTSVANKRKLEEVELKSNEINQIMDATIEEFEKL